MDVIGKLAHSQHNSAAYTERLAGFTSYLEQLRDQGLVRTDLSLRAQTYMISAIFLGFFLAAPLLPDTLALPDEELADMLAETVHRALETDGPAAPDMFKPPLPPLCNTLIAIWPGCTNRCSRIPHRDS